MRKKLAMLLACVLAAIPVVTNAAASNYYYNGSKAVKNSKGTYKAYYAGKLVSGSNNEPAVMINDNLMIPYKQSLIEKGPKLQGGYSGSVVTLYNSKVRVTMKLDEKYATVNGVKKELNTPAKKVKYNGHTAIYVPAKKISQFFSFKYTYTKSKKRIDMSHVHTWGSYTTTKEATCTESGSKYRICSTCGNKETVTIAKLGHNWDKGVISSGDIKYTCTRCGDTKTVKGIQATVFKPQNTNKFISAIGNLAKAYYRQHGGVLPSITIAQAIQESGWGTSELSQKGNNLFGMKTSLSGNNWAGSTWDGKSSVAINSYEAHLGRKKVSYFRKYDCVEKSIGDHAQYLFNAKKTSTTYRYPNIRKKYNISSVSKNQTAITEQLKSLRSGGYCTNDKYASNIKALISKYNLSKYDR